MHYMYPRERESMDWLVLLPRERCQNKKHKCKCKWQFSQTGERNTIRFFQEKSRVPTSLQLAVTKRSGSGRDRDSRQRMDTQMRLSHLRTFQQFTLPRHPNSPKEHTTTQHQKKTKNKKQKNKKTKKQKNKKNKKTKWRRLGKHTSFPASSLVGRR